MTTISNGAALTAAVSRNVTTLTQTQRLIDQVQNRLATGQRVSSALDNPSSYFTASALSNKARQLNSVLDNFAEKIGAIDEANNAIGALQELITQIQGVADSALEQLQDSPAEAEISGDRSLSGFTDLPADVAGVDNGDRLVFSFVDTGGTIDSGNIVTIANGDSSNDLVNNINAIVNSSAAQVFDASLDSSGRLKIKTNDATRFEIQFQTSGGAADSQLASALGFGDFDLTARNDGTAGTRITVLPTASVTTTPLFAAGGARASASTTLLNLTDSASGVARDIFDGDANDQINISVNGNSAVNVVSDISTATLQNLIDNINNNGSLGSQIQASFNAGTGELNIRAIDEDVVSIQIELEEDAAGAGTAGKVDLQKLGIGTRVLQSGADGSAALSSESLLLGPGVSTLASLEEDFNTIRSQIDDLVEDSEFYNVNLLQGDDLSTVFNPDGSSTLVTEGTNLTSDDLGIEEANFGSTALITNAKEQAEEAETTVENFATSLSTDLSVIEARQTFTEETINTLEGGAEDLTIADSNEDGALLLALQTRQALGATGLALALQGQQSTLRLF